MGQQTSVCACNNNSDKFIADNYLAEKSGSVPPEERRDLVLEFLISHDIPLPPLAIYAGMKRQYRITFSYRTMQNIVTDLVDRGDLFRVDTNALKDGEIQEIEGGGRRKTYYFPTEQGREKFD